MQPMSPLQRNEKPTGFPKAVSRNAASALFLFLAVLSAAQLPALGDREKPHSGTTDADTRVPEGVGRVPRLSAPPHRIISGTLFTDEILLSLGLAERLAAVTPFAEDPAISNIASDLPRDLPRVPFSVEVYLSLRPDLVLLAEWSDPAGVRQLREADIPVLLIRTPRAFDEITALIRTLAGLTGTERRGEDLVGRMERTLAEVRDRVGDVPRAERPRVADLTPSGVSLGTGTSWDAIIRAAGCVNAFEGIAGDRWGNVPVSTELLIALDPDILVIPDWFYGEPEEYADTFHRQVLSDPALQGLTAVREDRVIRIPERHRLSTSHFMALSVADLARAAYPEKFSREAGETR